MYLSKVLTVFLFINSSILLYSQVGINTTTPQNTLDVNGWLKIGNESSNQGVSVEGSFRYNSMKKCMEFYDGSVWNCIGQPLLQEHLINDGIDSNITTNESSNFVNENTNGYGGIKVITVNNVSPGSKILFLIEIGLGVKNRINSGYSNTIKVYGNGIWKEIEAPNSGNNESASFFIWGEPNNTSMNNLNFLIESNMSYYNLKITTVLFK